MEVKNNKNRKHRTEIVVSTINLTALAQRTTICFISITAVKEISPCQPLDKNFPALTSHRC